MFSIDTKQFKLFFVGRPVVEKGLNELLMALALLPMYNWTLTIVGEVPILKNSPEIIETFNSERIVCLGPVNNNIICKLLNQHDIVIVPSHYENFGNIVLEAMACGKAIVVSRTGGLQEIIKDEYNGIHCFPKDPFDLSLKLKMIFEAPGLINELGDNALKEVQQYSWSNIIKKTVTLFKRYL